MTNEREEWAFEFVLDAWKNFFGKKEPRNTMKKDNKDRSCKMAALTSEFLYGEPHGSVIIICESKKHMLCFRQEGMDFSSAS